RIAELSKKWGRTTTAQHKSAMIEDACRALDESEFIGACKRLAYYYPDALEPLALRLLALPVYDQEDVKGWGGELRTAEIAQDRRQRFRDFVARHGQGGREGLRRTLFAELQLDEETPAILRDDGDDGSAARWPLVALFGYRKDVRSADRPGFLGA